MATLPHAPAEPVESISTGSPPREPVTRWPASFIDVTAESAAAGTIFGVVGAPMRPKLKPSSESTPETPTDPSDNPSTD